MKFPILVRTRNRPDYLHLTLKSLTATNLLDGEIIIMDDHSDDELTKEYLYTNNNIVLPEIDWENQILNNEKRRDNDLEIFKKYFTDLPEVNKEANGIKNRFPIISSNECLGVKNGFLWSVLKRI